ncbi:forkhead box protein N2 [Octodon degus]|uniref:Forkhead box protein N2 n=1 Tax=Octodon degus TaxID=10160 RepID=A0A6P3EM92_OCTDE|nr:forkhead box protein N2 [Octodon degus]XP_023567030.1 forkhead box protein N2 [Octodon degus]XP_023567031.1 forkhead box protein N2 [Octodon degus]XP_023567032.1 forkhead box protein N2 [Octodon degus]XP_023567033.1 forkhead box protein N2 [Octodon degus]
MGPVIGMTPDKRAETPGAEKVAGLSQIYTMGSLPEAADAARPEAALVGNESADDELTSLNWLHESTNLLTNFSLGGEGLPGLSPLYDIEGGVVPSHRPPCHQNPDNKATSSKPPYSFSLLIYMAIEHSPNKCLPVKEIYSWILDRFPYFATAPTGWKNSVRHNLSLNKCFQKVERSHGKVNGKGSLWCVDPEYKPNLMQALKKQPFSSPQSGSLSPHYLNSVLKQDQVQTLKESDIDAATAMILLNTSIEQGILECEKPLPLKTSPQTKRSYGLAFSHPSAGCLQESSSLATSTDPKEDHNYSASGSGVPRCASRLRVSSLSSVDEVYEFIPKSSHTGSDGSEGFRSEEDTDGDYDEDPLGDSGYVAQACADLAREGQLGKKMRKQSCQEIDEELREAAGSLLHLAGIRTCLSSLIGTAVMQSQKQWKK